MTDRSPDPTEAGRAWMRGDLSSRDYFDLVRRVNRRPNAWQRIKQAVKKKPQRPPRP